MFRSRSPRSLMGTGEHPQTPPLTIPASDGEPLGSDPSLALHPGQSHRPFSPLTLDELGLHPPSTPSALLDTVTPVSLPLLDDTISAAQSLDARPTSAHKSQDCLIKDGQPANFQDHARKRDNEAACSAALFSSTSSGPTLDTHDSFLASFLQSLSGDSVDRESQVSTSTTITKGTVSTDSKLTTIEIQPSKKPPSQLNASSLPDSAAVQVAKLVEWSKTPASPARSHSSRMHPVKSQYSIASNPLGENPMSDFHQLFQTPSAAQNLTKHGWASPRQFSSSNWPSSPSHSQSSLANRTLISNTSRVSRTNWFGAPAASQRSESGHVTSTPLEPSRTTSQTSDSQAEAAKLASSSRDSVSTYAVQDGDPSKASWLQDLPSMTHLSLPQAPPLQPEHRYPISILETDGNYETDLDTDRESETSPAVSNSFGFTSKSTKRKSLGMLQVEDQSDPTSNSQPSCSTFPAQSKQAGSEPRSSVASGGAENHLKIVPLSDVVRSKSWSDTSPPSTPGPGAPTWLVRSTEALQAERLAHSHATGAPGTTERAHDAAKSWSATLSALNSTTQVSTSSAASSTARGASYDFTRQALLDLIRRTNLGMASNASSSETNGTAKVKPSDSSQDVTSAPTSTSTSYSAASFSTAEPADLQARLQSWQLHRKRQKGFEEAAYKESKGQATSTASASHSSSRRRSIPSSSTAFSGTTLEDQIRSSKRNITEDQEHEHKARRQEHYQRLLFQLNAQMQMKMRMNMQKQKQKESQDKAQREASSQRNSDSSKGVEFRKPCPPSKASTAPKGGAEAPSALVRGKEDSDCCEHGSKVEQSSMYTDDQQTRKEHRTRSSVAATETNISAVESNRGTAGMTHIETDHCSLYGSSSILTSSAWPAGSEATLWNARQSGSISSRPLWVSGQQPGSTPWQAVCASQYEPSHSAYMPNWQNLNASFHQPFWLKRSSDESNATSDSHMAATTYSTPGTGLGNMGLFESSDSKLAMELMLKHPNWRRDMDAATLAAMSNCLPSGRSSYTPHFIDTSSFAISMGAESTLRTAGEAQNAVSGKSQPPSAAGNSSVKGPVSPGAEVVFWAVKGEHSVKLIGTVDSTTNHTATIVVSSGTAASNGTAVSETDDPSIFGQSSSSGRDDGDVREYYQNIPYVNIVAKDQAAVLGLS